MRFSAGARLGPYEIVSLLGRGGMGEVYRARDPRLGREVAVKVLPQSHDPARLARFDREARAAAGLSHPNILAVYDVGTEGGTPYVVSELLEGETLRARLQRGPMTVREAGETARQVACGLAAAHDRGVVHRDLKPDNLFLTRDGLAKILDFGLAKLRPPTVPDEEETGSLGPAAPVTLPGTLLGTLAYMAPEQVRALAADERSDIFALGAVLYEALAGRPAFRRSSAAETMAAVLALEPPELRGLRPAVPPALDLVVRRCLRKAADERFQSSRDLAFALETALAGQSAVSGGASETASRRRSVAVLPFKDLAQDPSNPDLGLGLADATITELAAMRSLLVRPTSSILRYRDYQGDPDAAARELDVDAVLDGRFQRSGSRLRVTVQLVASDGRPLWASKIDTSLDDVFEMQDQVSRRIGEALAVELSPSDERRLAAAARAARPSGEAYELYLRGRVHLASDALADLRDAIQWFEKACLADPGFGAAWAGLADARARMAFDYEPEAGWYEKAEEACRRALQVDPELPEARYVKARLRWTPRAGFDHEGALRGMLLALRGRPSLEVARVRMATVLFHVGLVEEAQRELEHALALSPDNLLAAAHVAACHFHLGRYRPAIEACRQVLTRMTSYWPHYVAVHSHLRLGELEPAARAMDRMEEQAGAEGALPLRGLLAALRGDAALALRQAEATERNKQAWGHYHHAQYDLACIQAVLGEPQAAVAWLEAASGYGYPCLSLFEADPLLTGLREEPSFQALAQRLRVERDGYRRLYGELKTDSRKPQDDE